MKNQKGFTLIELIVVIVILGILAATALPRFTNLQSDARAAKLNAARGAVQAAAAIIHSTALVRAGVADLNNCPGTAVKANNSTGATGQVCTEAGIINMVNGYPRSGAPVYTAATAGIISAAGLGTILLPTLAQLNADGYNVTGAGPTTISIIGATTPANCSFTYTNAAASGQPVVSAALTTGC